MTNLASRFHLIVGVLTLVLGFALSSITADAQVTPFKQALAEAAAKDKDIAAFYKANGFKSIWTGRSGKERQRRAALLQALSKSCLLYTSPSPRDRTRSRMPSSA